MHPPPKLVRTSHSPRQSPDRCYQTIAIGSLFPEPPPTRYMKIRHSRFQPSEWKPLVDVWTTLVQLEENEQVNDVIENIK